MAYTINRYDGQQLTQVLDATINNATDLKLVGRNFAGYGEVQNENFVYLLENFSGESEPENKIRGQLWFDTANQKIKIYSGNRWKTIGFIENSDSEPLQFNGDIWNDTVNQKLNFYDGESYRTIAITQNATESPNNLKEGDFWWNTETKQLFAYNGTDFDLIGPPRAGEEPTLMVSELVKDTENNDQALIRAVVDGESVFVISENEFVISSSTPVPGFSTVKKGITLINSESGRTKEENTWFWGTASDADRLDGLTSSQFLRRDIDSDTQGNIEFTNQETGLEWSNSSVKNTDNSLQVLIDNDSDFEIKSLIGQSQTSLLKVSTEQGIDGLTFRGGKVWHSDNDGPASGLNADLLDGEEGSYYLDWTNVTNKPDPTITLTGDVTGSVTLTDVNSGTLAAVVQKDSHRHTISTIDNLQSELDSKLPASEYTAQDVFDKVKTLDGAGSGLNADLLDGLSSSQFLRFDGKAVDSEKLDGLDSSAFLQRTGGNMTGNISFSDDGEGIVWSRDTDGASIRFYSDSDNDSNTRLEFQTRDNQDEFFLWSHKPTGGNPSIELMRLQPNNAQNGLTYRSNIVWHEGNQGSGSGLDADKLDGKHASEFLGKNETATFAENADKLDGFQSNYFMPKSGGTFSGYISVPSNPTSSFHAVPKSYVDNNANDFGYIIYYSDTNRQFTSGGDVPFDSIEDSYNVAGRVSSSNLQDFVLAPGSYRISYLGRFYELNSSPPCTLRIRNQNENRLLRYTRTDAELDGGAEHNTLSFSFPYHVNQHTTISLYANTNSSQRSRLSWATLAIEIIN
jgi:hypothetical protein